MQFGRDAEDAIRFVRDPFWDQVLRHMSQLRKEWMDTGILEELILLENA